MQATLWSVNRLAAELAIDRRTLNKRLEGLEPDEVQSIGNRKSKLYLLARVFEHLSKPAAPSPIEGDMEAGDLPAFTEKDLLDRERKKMVAFERAIKAGEYIKTEDAIAEYAGMCAEAKARLRGIPARLAPRLVGEEDPAAIQSKINAEIDDCLDSLADVPGSAA